MYLHKCFLISINIEQNQRQNDLYLSQVLWKQYLFIFISFIHIVWTTSMRDSTCLSTIISKINLQLVYHKLSILYTWHAYIYIDKWCIHEIDNIRSEKKIGDSCSTSISTRNKHVLGDSFLNSLAIEIHDNHG